MSNVIPLAAKRAEHLRPAGCWCSSDVTCGPHRVAAAAEMLRSSVAGIDHWLVMRSDVEAMVEAVLAELDAVTLHYRTREETR